MPKRGGIFPAACTAVILASDWTGNTPFFRVAQKKDYMGQRGTDFSEYTWLLCCQVLSERGSLDPSGTA